MTFTVVGNAASTIGIFYFCFHGEKQPYICRDFFERLSSDSDIIVEGIAFLYTSALLFMSMKYGKGSRTAGETTVPAALTIGVFQGIALVPGISRSGSTISAALFTGMKREDAVEYSFILGIPVILAGAVVKLGEIQRP